MFFRVKKSGPRSYLQIVENRWEDGRTKQRVLVTLGRAEELVSSGQLDALLASGSRFCEKLLVLQAHAAGELPGFRSRHLGPALVFERLWRESGCRAVIEELLAERRFDFPVERMIFLSVLQQLFEPGSDRACFEWKEDFVVEGIEELSLHHSYRTMAWLGEVLPETEQEAAMPWAPRCVKDLIEERLFQRQRDLFTDLELIFFDTTSIYFEGEGGESLGQRGLSKDKRPDLKQMVVGVVIDDQGRPICCELWPGNTTDVKTLIPVAERMKRRFGIERICLVADRGMIQKKTLKELERQGWPYILGARMRSWKEVREKVLARAGRYREVHPERTASTDPSPLQVKEVWVEDRRYVVCLNPEQARKDAADREAILAALEQQLRQGPKSLVGNRGFRKYLQGKPGAFVIDQDKIRDEARYDGKWVLRTNTDLDAAQVALKYKQLWMVEALFRSLKSLLQVRPIWHKTDAAIRGHVFCAFLALLLRAELAQRLDQHGEHGLEWQQILRDLKRLQQSEIEARGQRFLLRTGAQGTASAVCRAVGVALPPTIQTTQTAAETPAT
jgi:transposase